MIPLTQNLRFLVAVRPGLSEPSMTARMAATFDRLSGGRLLVNVVAGGDPVELKADGIWLDHSERYEATAEYLTVWRKLLSGETLSFSGKYTRVENSRLIYQPVQRPHPPLYFGGSSGPGQRVAAEHIDVYLTWGEPPADVAEKIAQAKALAAERGRTLRFGIRLHVIVRETEEEAWREAESLIRYVDERAIEIAQKAFSRSESVGQKRMAHLHGGSRDKLEISPNLWAGIGLVRGGAGTALVGSPEQVADRIREYAEIGIDQFIFSGYPHLEECYRFADLVFPLLPLRGSQRRTSWTADVDAGPYGGEVIANWVPPARKAVGD